MAEIIITPKKSAHKRWAQLDCTCGWTTSCTLDRDTVNKARKHFYMDHDRGNTIRMGTHVIIV